MARRRGVVAALLLATGAAAQGSAVTGIEWAAEEILGHAVAPGVEVTLTLDGAGRAFGRSGCNRFTGGATIGDGTLRFGQMAGTRMACPEPQMQAEQATLDAFTRTRLFVLDGSRSKLRLMDEAGATLMVLSR
jgi:putative lipoprotein